MRLWLVLYVMSGEPIVALVDSTTCLTIVETVKSGHELDLVDEEGNRPTILSAECRPPCDDACV